MAYDLATAKKRLGIDPGDTSQDADVTIAMNGALALCEQFCMRNFFYSGDTAKYYYATQARFHVDRYPIDEIVSIATGNGSAPEYKLNREGGWLDFRCPTYFEELTVEYRGGYMNADLPADLEMSLWLVFDNVWSVQSGTGLSSAAGDIASITVPDVGTIRFNSAGEGDVSVGPVGAIPGNAVAALWNYRRAYA